MSKRSKIPEKKSDHKNVQLSKKPELSSNHFNFDLRDNRWLSGVNVGKFTNKLKDLSSYSQFITEILGKLIPEVQEKSEDIIKTREKGFHCHAIEQGQKEYDIVIDVMRELYGKTFEESIDSHQQIYQIGVTGSLRIITLRNRETNVIKPLFIDYYHLTYPDPKYNQTDYVKRNFCPVTQFLQ